ncbi:hypothetical protein [Carnobacterium pleistocenium]|uniref:hypothetical protein n=1 Tax=Carnobacterium pleistocenium TaxID=181073 RepID=UPI000552EAFF|nr:hypothetical protein [Carnobacterium pleistocenium]
MAIVEIKTDKIKDKYGAYLKVEEYINNGEERVQLSTADFESDFTTVDLKKEDWIEFLKEQLGGIKHENE